MSSDEFPTHFDDGIEMKFELADNGDKTISMTSRIFHLFSLDSEFEPPFHFYN